MQRSGRLTFPKVLEVEGKVLASGGADINGDGIDELIVAIKDGLILRVLTWKWYPPANSEASGEWKLHDKEKVGTLRRSPEHMVCDDFNGDGREDIILMIPREPAHILLSNRQGKLKLAAKTSTVRTGQFVDLTPAEFGVGAMGNDSMPNLLIAKKGYIRSFQLIKMNDQTEDPWSLEVVDQGNARQGKDFIKGPVIVPTEKSIQLVAYDSGEEAVQFLEKDSDNTYRYLRSLDTGRIHVTGARLLPLEGASQRLLIFGKDRFWLLPLSGKAWSAEETSTWRSTYEKTRFNFLHAGDLSGDGIDEIVAIDGKKGRLFILKSEESELQSDANEQWREIMSFKVFTKSPFSRRKTKKGSPLQPQTIRIDDFNGDGTHDLIIFCHDRLILYPVIVNKKESK